VRCSVLERCRSVAEAGQAAKPSRVPRRATETYIYIYIYTSVDLSIPSTDRKWQRLKVASIVTRVG
jgi:hypothetical protein